MLETRPAAPRPRDRRPFNPPARKAYSFERAGGLWVPKGKRVDVAPVGMGRGLGLVTGQPRAGNSPVSMLDANLLKAWWIADRGLALNSTLKHSAGSATGNVTISGNLSQSSGIAFKIDSVAGGTARGQATFSAYNDGGTTPYSGLTGITTAADVDLTSTLGVHVQWPSATFSTSDLYVATTASWTDQFGGHVALGSGGVTSSPYAVWQGLNNRPIIKCDGSNSTRLICSSSLASNWSGDDVPITIFMVMKADATPSAANPWVNFSNSAGGSTARWDFGVVNTPAYRSTKTDDAAATALPTGGTTDTGWHYSTWNQSGTTLVLRVDGSAISLSGSGAQNVGTCTFDQVVLFGRNTAGVGSNSIVGSLAEVLIYAGTLSAASVLEKETYLKSQWRL